MSKDSKKNRKTSLADSHFVRQARYLLKDWDIKVMSYVMIVVVSVAMIAATVAWFTYFRVVAVSNMGFTAAGCESLKVEVKQGTTDDGSVKFVELEEGEEDSVFVNLDMPVFDNVEQYEITVGSTETSDGEQSGSETEDSPQENISTTTKKVSKMAPGVYGSLTIRLTTLNKDVNQYQITPATLFTYIDGTSDYVKETGNIGTGVTSDITDTDEGAEDAATGAVPTEEFEVLQQLAKGHILFFEDRVEITDSNTTTDGTETTITIGNETKPITDYTYNKKYVYYNQIENGNYMTGELLWDEEADEGKPTEVTLYWYWPYEYNNLSSEIKNNIQLPSASDELSQIVTDSTKLMYFDKDKMKEIVNDSISWNETQLYDYADTRIGTYVRNIRIHLKVDGYHAAETQTESTE